MTQSPALKQYKYKAFISYSHAADGRLAPTLQSALHRFAKPWNRLRAMRVFRDQTGLGVTPALWGSIQAALEESEYFLLLASPKAAQSAWVDREVEYWLNERSSSHLLIVLTDGELKWGGADFDWNHTDSLPRRLERTFRDEPKHLDLRWARTATDLSLRQPQFLEAVATLASTLQGQPLDTMIGEDVLRHRKTRLLMRAATIALSGLLAVALLAATLAIRQRNVANQQRAIAEHERNRAREQQKLAEERGAEARRQQLIAEEQREQGRQRLVRLNVANGLELVDEGDFSGGLLWFAEALRLEPDGSRGQGHQRLRLNSVLRQHPALERVWSTGQGFPRFSRDGRHVFVDTDEGEIHIWDVNSGLAVTLPKDLKGRVLAVDFSAKSKRVVVGAELGARVLDGQTGKDLFALPAGEVNSANFSPDGRLLATTHGQTAKLWDAQSGSEIQAFPHDEEVQAVELSRDARLLLTMAHKTIRVWDLGARTSQVFKHERDVVFADLSSHGNWLLTLNDERALRLWNLATGDSRSWLGDWGVLENAELSPDGNHLVMVNMNGTVARIWNLTADREVASVEHQGFILRAGFSPDGRQLVTAGTDQVARVWNVQSGVAVSPPLHHEDTVRGAAFSPDGNLLATTTASGLVRVWNLEPRSALVLKHDRTVNSAQFIAGQRKLLTTTDSGVRLWDVERRTSFILDLTSQLYHTSVSPSGQRIVTACEDGKASLWNAHSGKNLATLTHQKRVRHAMFSPDETLLAAASGNTLWLWDLRTHVRVAAFQHDSPVLYAEFSRDGKRVLSVDFGGTEHVWEISRREEVPHLRRRDVNLARFSPDGAFLATASGVSVQIWDSISGARRVALPAQDYRLTSLAFSPDSRLLLTANQGGTARVWDASTGSALTPPLKHAGAVMSASFSPDGSQVLTASEDHTARLWDAETGSALIPPLRHRDAVRVASFGAGGRCIVTGSYDETARVWDLSPSDLLFSESSPLEHQLLLSQLVSSRRIDETGAIAALGAAEFLSTWRKVQALRSHKQ